jgi:hypothetical protein
MAYPATNTPIPSYAGTALMGDIDHAGWHATTNTDLDGVKTVLGVNAGTAVLKNFVAGDFAAKSSDIPDTTGMVTTGGTQTLNNKTLTSPKLNEDVVLTATATQLNALVGAGGSDGWTSAGETWTYNSASSITVPAGAAAKYQKGDRIRYKQGAGYKYATISAVSDTLLSLALTTDYTVATPTAITDNYYSHVENPMGYPHWFNATAPVFYVNTYDDGSGGQPTTTICRFKLSGNQYTIQYKGNGVKATTDNHIFVDTHSFIAPVNTTVLYGVAEVVGASVLFGQVVDAALNCYIVGTVSDNQAISPFSYTVTYEI